MLRKHFMSGNCTHLERSFTLLSHLKLYAALFWKEKRSWGIVVDFTALKKEVIKLGSF